MQPEDLPPDPPEEIPEDATILRQIQWAWLWSSAPWIIVLGALFQFGLIPDPFIASLIALIIMVPRYFQYRRTAYIITDDSVIYKRGGLTGSQTYTIPISRLRDVKSRYGMFGRTLGYQTIDIMLDNGALASLTYVPALMEVAEHLRGKMDSSGFESRDGSENGSPEEPPATDPDCDPEA